MARAFRFQDQMVAQDIVRNPTGFAEFLAGFKLKPPFVVKPNWINEELAHLTDPLVLGWLLEHLSSVGETIVVEAYSARNQTMKLKRNPGETKVEIYRRTEKIFLKRQGLRQLFDRLGVDYLNVDEEVMAGRVADPQQIRAETEATYTPVERSELYSYVPSSLYELRKGTMISFAKFKLTFSMCTKNLFGLIPDLSGAKGRGSYHGKKDRDLPRNIIDVNKIYRAAFNVVGMVEGVRTATGFIDRGPHHSMFGYDFEVHEGLGLIYFGTDPLWLDVFIACQCGIDPRTYRTTTIPQPHLALGYREISPWPIELEQAARAAGSPV